MWNDRPLWRPLAPEQGISVLLVTLGALVISTPAVAQTSGTELAAFERGEVSDQLEMDVTPIPVGMGALFVPSRTAPKLEPPVLIYFRGDRVAFGQTGQRIVLPPGEYEVVVGHGPLERRPRATVRVIDGVTTPVDPFFAALRVNAVGVDGRAVAIGYSVQSGDGAIVWGEGKTTTQRDYTATRTWFLPGEAVVVRIDTGLSDDQSIAIPLTEGQLVRYRLVMDHGRLVRAEIAEREVIAETRWWRLRWVLGGDVGFNRTAGQLGAFNGDSWRLGVFTRATVGLDLDHHLALLNFSVDESWLSYDSLDGQELRPTKISDEVLAELSYTYRLGGIVGPYARAQARTSLFDTVIHPGEGASVAVTEDGERRAYVFDEGEDLELLAGLSPLVFREGAGVDLAFVDNETVTFSLRGGVGARQAYYDEGLYLEGRSGETLELLRLADDESFGAEAGLIAGLRLGQTMSWESRGDLYVPSGQLFDAKQVKELRPVFRWANTFTLSFNSLVAAVYDMNIRRDAYEIDEAQVSHILSLRLQHTLF